MNRKEPDWDFADLLLDDSFVKQVNDPLHSESFLQEMKYNFPEKAKDIEMAVTVLRDVKNKRGNYSPELKLRLWNKIVRSKGQRRLTFMRIAAGIILVVGFWTIVMYSIDGREKIEVVASDFVSRSDTPELDFADGRQVSIDGEGSISYSVDGANIEINDTAKISQNVNSNDYNQLITSYGKNVSLVLSDGTKVWLHSGSRLVYPPVFKGKIREVYLYGEAYFEVTTNNEKPFIVKTDHFNTKVCGTKFAVQAYGKEDLYSTILLEGQVKLLNNKGILSREITLEPGQRGSINGKDHGFDIKKEDHPENYISWVYGHLSFDKEDLDHLLGRVKRYYNLQIELPGSIPQKVISGKLDLKEDPARVLAGIAAIANLRLWTENNEYKFYNK